VSFLRKLAMFLLLLTAASPAFAQSCAMCRANAKATPKEGQRAINNAIFLMMIPPLGMVTLGVRLIVRYSKKRDEENDRS
jgi:hypothetical protein